MWLAFAVAVTAPAWIVKYPPIQDMPFHLAAIRVIHSFHDPAYGFDQEFVLQLGRTQYVFYYLVAGLLSYLVGVVKANIFLMCCYLGGTPLALRALLRELGKDERLAILCVPLLANVMFLFGLLPFVLGVPLLFWGLALSVRWFDRFQLKDGVLLACVAVALFYSHVFPFGLFGLGFAAMFPWSRPRRWIGAGLPTVPALLALVRWTVGTDAGQLTAGALRPGPEDHVQPLNAAIPGAYQWLTDIWHDQSDELVLVLLGVLAILVTGFAAGDRDRSKPVARFYTLLPVACIYFYLTLGEQHGYIWLISQRFPILGIMCALPLLRFPQGMRGWLGTAGALAVAAMSVVTTCKHFIAFQLDDVGDFDDALEAMAPRKKVAALIYDRGSSVQNYAPFLHFGSYYQVEKGGVVQFTYAGYDHWPFRFKPGHAPPQGARARNRWEWTPESVPVVPELYPYYDYVLTRGGGFRPPPGTYHVKYRGEHWTVWAKDT